MDPSALTTIRYEAADGVATITLDRAESHNAFTTAMCDEMAATWAHVRDDDRPGDRGDGRRREGLLHRHRPQRGAGRRRASAYTFDPLTYRDPGAPPRARAATSAGSR